MGEKGKEKIPGIRRWGCREMVLWVISSLATHKPQRNCKKSKNQFSPTRLPGYHWYTALWRVVFTPPPHLIGSFVNELGKIWWKSCLCKSSTGRNVKKTTFSPIKPVLMHDWIKDHFDPSHQVICGLGGENLIRTFFMQKFLENNFRLRLFFVNLMVRDIFAITRLRRVLRPLLQK